LLAPRADAFVIDLDSIAQPAARAASRAALAEAAASSGVFPLAATVAVRVAPVAAGSATSGPAGFAAVDQGSALGLDIVALRAPLAAGSLHAVVLPRVERAAQLRALRAALGPGSEAGDTAIWACIETPRGVLAVAEIAAACAETGTTCLVAGTAELCRALRAQLTAARTPLLASLSAVVLGARAYGVRALDGPHLALDDEDGLRVSCQQGRELGFDGKLLIDASQVEEANSNFAPSPAEVEAATRIVAAWTAAREAGGGAVAGGFVVVRNRVVEDTHAEEAQELLAIAAAIAAREAQVA
jgi:citrate lyase subunit beta/citryl-CoA lyase